MDKQRLLIFVFTDTQIIVRFQVFTAVTMKMAFFIATAVKTSLTGWAL
jgi:hypothetical protein